MTDSSPAKHSTSKPLASENTLPAESPASDDSLDSQRPGWRASITKHWIIMEAPVTMTVLLMAGALLVVGHHLYYTALDGKTVTELGERNWGQQFNLAVGTALAFLVKASLVSAVSAAYAQHFWLDVRDKFLPVSGIDSRFTALSSIFSMFDLPYHGKAKTGTILAVLTWILPLAAVFTPSTLTVESVTALDLQDRPVPVINFTSMFGIQDTRDSTSSPVNRIANLVVSGAQIQPVPAFVPQGSYTLEFNGPSLKCSPPSNETTIQMIDGAFEAVDGSSSGVPNAVYMAFSPYTSSWRYWPFDTNDTPLEDPPDWELYAETCLTGGQSDCSFTTPVFSGRPCGATSGRCEGVDTSNALWLRLAGDLLTCSIVKTLYQVDFDASHMTTSLRSYKVTKGDPFDVLEDESTEVAGYVTLTQMLFNILAGATYYSTSFCALSSMQMTKCSTSIAYLRSRTSVHETALGGLILDKANTIYDDIWSAVNVNDTYASPNGAPPAQDADLAALAGDRSTAELIEDMSHNLTLSMFANPQYLINDNRTAEVTITSSRNVYAYQPRNLIIAYSVAFAAALSAVVVGFVSYIANGHVSSSMTFSTTLVATRNNLLDELVRQNPERPLVVSQPVLATKLRYGQLQKPEVADTAADADATVAVADRPGENPNAEYPTAMGFGMVGQIDEPLKGYRLVKPEPRSADT